MRYTAVLVVVAFAGVASGQSRVVKKAELAKYMAGEAKQIAAAVIADREAEAKAKLDATRKAKIDRRLRANNGYEIDGAPKRELAFASDRDKRVAIVAAERELAAVQAEAKLPVVPSLPVMYAHRLEVGAVGMLRCIAPESAKPEDARAMTVVYVPDDDTAAVEMGRGESRTQFALKTSTIGVVDGRKFDAGFRCFEVVGTTMVAGRTMFAVQAIDADAILKDAKH